MFKVKDTYLGGTYEVESFSELLPILVKAQKNVSTGSHDTWAPPEYVWKDTLQEIDEMYAQGNLDEVHFHLNDMSLELIGDTSKETD